MIGIYRFAAVSALGLSVLAVGGCDKKDTIEARNESAESVAEKVAKSDIAVRPAPGRWESTVKIEKLEIPNLPPQARETMQHQMGSAQNFASCLTPEQAAKPNAGFFQQGASGCTYDNFSMSDGKIDATMTCNHGGGKQKMSMSGTYGPESYTIAINSDATMPGGMNMTMIMSVAAKRVGECRGNEGG